MIFNHKIIPMDPNLASYPPFPFIPDPSAPSISSGYWLDEFECKKRSPGPKWAIARVEQNKVLQTKAMLAFGFPPPFPISDEDQKLLSHIKTNWIDEIYALHKDFSSLIPSSDADNWFTNIYGSLWEPEVINSKEHVVYQRHHNKKRKRHRLPKKTGQALIKRQKSVCEAFKIRDLNGTASWHYVFEETITDLKEERKASFRNFYKQLIGSQAEI